MKRLGSQRDYKSRDKLIRKNLNRYELRVKELISQGMNKEEASKKAYQEIVN